MSDSGGDYTGLPGEIVIIGHHWFILSHSRSFLGQQSAFQFIFRVSDNFYHIFAEPPFISQLTDALKINPTFVDEELVKMTTTGCRFAIALRD